MVSKIHIAMTSPINPPGSSPTITVSQVWAGLQRKITHAPEFVPAIKSCDVLEVKDGVVTREITTQPGMGLPDRIREEVTGFEECWVDFKQKSNDTYVRNVISEGTDLDGNPALYMTYVFQYHFEDVEPKSEEETKKKEHLKMMAKKAVDSSIDVIREMVKDGRIK
jgi:hypothetical protein